jgi:endoglucanase
MAINPTSITSRRALAASAAALMGLCSLLAEPQPLRVQGNQLVDAGGRPARLRGVNCAGMEFSSNGEGRILTTVETAVTQWHANLIRLPLSQDRWFGRAPDQQDGGVAYRALVGALVDFCRAHNAHILLDLHWSDAGEWGKNIGQHDLPDANSLVFWKDMAPVYRGNPAVLFDLYNEPTRITWDQWLKGGPVTEKDEKTGAVLNYQAVGMQEVLDAIRSTGAMNVAVAGGINWSYEVGGILDGRQLADPHGDGVVYAAHPYPHPFKGIGRETIPQWEARMEAFGQRLPFIVSEFGSSEADWPFPKEWNYNNERWNREMLGVLKANDWNWTAWDFHPKARPCLISDWNYTPTADFGVWVKQALAENVP